MSVVAAVKRYVSDDCHRLRLFDTVADDVRRVLESLRDERFSVTAGWSDEGFRKRIPAFDEQFTELAVSSRVAFGELRLRAVCED